MFKVKKPQKVGAKGTVLIPKNIREKAGIKPNSQIIFSLNDDNQIIMEIITDPVKELQNMFDGLDLVSAEELVKNFKEEENKLGARN